MKTKKILTQEEKERNYKKALYFIEKARKAREEEEKEGKVIKVSESGKNKVGVGKEFELAVDCKEVAPRLVKELKHIAFSSRSKPQVKIRAISELLDRGYGKAKETILQVGGPRIIEIIRPGVGKDTSQPEIITPAGHSGLIGTDESQPAGGKLNKDTVQ